MPSIQSKIVRSFLKANQSRQPLDLNAIPAYRAKFERDLRILFPTLSSRHVRHVEIAGLAVDEVSPLHSPRYTILYIHGGAFALGSSRSYRQHLVRIARICNARVLSVDYELSPEHPFPYASNQILKAWPAICAQYNLRPEKLVWMGDSAGANIALSTALRLRDSDPSMLPGCIALQSPGLDATLDGESYTKNKERDVILTPAALEFYMKTYVQDHDKNDPFVSPVFADLRGLPPLLIHIGSDELQLSSSLKLHEHAKRDGLDVELFVGEAMWHNWHLFAGIVPEAKDALYRMRDFIDERIAE